MFKKRFKIQNTHAVSNKDRKNIRDVLLKLQYDSESVTHVLNDKNFSETCDDAQLNQNKVQGSKCVIYSRDGIPLLFCPEPKQQPIFPSVYFLFSLSPTSQSSVSLLPLKIYLKEGVQQFIFNGADLMWPGIRQISHAKGFEEFAQDDVVVVYAWNSRVAIDNGGEDPSGEEKVEGDEAAEDQEEEAEEDSQQKKAVKYEIVYVPVATGRMLRSGDIPQNEEGLKKMSARKGKAVAIEHFLFDELWNFGNRKMPAEVQFKQEAQEQQTAGGDNKDKVEKYEEEKVADGDDKKQKSQSQPEGASLDPYPSLPGDDDLSGQIVEKQDPPESVDPSGDDGGGPGDDGAAQDEAEEDQLSQAEWDERVIEAFKRTLNEIFKEENLPMEPSDFWKLMQEYTLSDHTKIDLKKSSFKKIGKLCENMSDSKNGLGLISYVEEKKKGHKLITRVTTGWQQDFAPAFKLRRAKAKQKEEESKTQGQDGNDVYPKIQISEVYTLGKSLSNMNGCLKEPIRKQYFDIKEVKDLIILQYVKENELEGEHVKRGHVSIDPQIARLVGDVKPGQQDVRKEYIFKNISAALDNCYTVTLIDVSQIVTDKQRLQFHKGDVPKVHILAQKVNNKKQTMITGLDLYLIDLPTLATYLQHKCASSVSIKKLEHLSTPKSAKHMVEIQGNQIKAMEDILTEKYKVPQKYLTTEDKCGGKKKK